MTAKAEEMGAARAQASTFLRSRETRRKSLHLASSSGGSEVLESSVSIVSSISVTCATLSRPHSRHLRRKTHLPALRSGHAACDHDDPPALISRSAVNILPHDSVSLPSRIVDSPYYASVMTIMHRRILLRSPRECHPAFRTARCSRPRRQIEL